MSINAKQFREFIVRPTLQLLDMYSMAAENLVMLTTAQESHMGRYIHQIDGPALGVCQMELATHDDIWKNYLSYHADISKNVSAFASMRYTKMPIPAVEMVGNLMYAIAMCRVHYRRVTEALPDEKDITGLALYYKKYYNTTEGAATMKDIIQNYRTYRGV